MTNHHFYGIHYGDRFASWGEVCYYPHTDGYCCSDNTWLVPGTWRE